MSCSPLTSSAEATSPLRGAGDGVERGGADAGEGVVAWVLWAACDAFSCASPATGGTSEDVAEAALGFAVSVPCGVAAGAARLMRNFLALGFVVIKLFGLFQGVEDMKLSAK